MKDKLSPSPVQRYNKLPTGGNHVAFPVPEDAKDVLFKSATRSARNGRVSIGAVLNIKRQNLYAS